VGNDEKSQNNRQKSRDFSPKGGQNGGIMCDLWLNRNVRKI